MGLVLGVVAPGDAPAKERPLEGMAVLKRDHELYFGSGVVDHRGKAVWIGFVPARADPGPSGFQFT